VQLVARLVCKQPVHRLALTKIAIAQLERRCRHGAYWAMALETINGTLQLTRLTNESAEYVARREELRLAEIELMRQRERVAAMRRRLPPGTVIQDYAFQEGPANLDAGDAPIATVRLSDLFTGPNRSVMIYHLMYGKRQTTPCPMCTMWIDGYNGVGHHIAQNVDFAIAAAADPPLLRQRCLIHI
jgi:predicted dithiol-disulfide oxidoreductase (DUF899 family)